MALCGSSACLQRAVIVGVGLVEFLHPPAAVLVETALAVDHFAGSLLTYLLLTDFEDLQGCMSIRRHLFAKQIKLTLKGGIGGVKVTYQSRQPFQCVHLSIFIGVKSTVSFEVSHQHCQSQHESVIILPKVYFFFFQIIIHMIHNVIFRYFFIKCWIRSTDSSILPNFLPVHVCSLLVRRLVEFFFVHCSGCV